MTPPRTRICHPRPVWSANAEPKGGPVLDQGTDVLLRLINVSVETRPGAQIGEFAVGWQRRQSLKRGRTITFLRGSGPARHEQHPGDARQWHGITDESHAPEQQQRDGEQRLGARKAGSLPWRFQPQRSNGSVMMGRASSGGASARCSADRWRPRR